MKALSIVGIILFTWLLSNRYNQYEAAIYYAGKSITYTDDVVNRAKHTIMLQMVVGGYGLIYAVAGTVYFFKRKDKANIAQASDKAIIIN